MLGRLVCGHTARSLMLALSATTVVVMTQMPMPTRGHLGAASEELAEAQGSCPAGELFRLRRIPEALSADQGRSGVCLSDPDRPAELHSG